MCGIVGLFLKTPEWEPQIGRLTAEMLEIMTDRGPDSAGFAVYGHQRPDRLKFTLRGGNVAALPALLGGDVDLDMRDDHALLTVAASDEAAVRQVLREKSPETRIVGVGSRMELYKGVGRPREVSARFGLPGMSGTHAIGHTRMATESAVTTAGAHPFSTGMDQCLVHNGSLSNHNNVRRNLVREGQTFETANDSEVAAGYLSWRMAQGAPLEDALHGAMADLDGFYTFVVGTASGFGVLRDPVACKPAVMAETDSYVAFGSEFRALTKLPGIDQAHIFEPEPQRVYVWERAA
jgi:methylamine---glutamate N-methyltransferase subunit A